jgi:phenylpropionate dioxygenase-like ring-hydroxylating dioxygenase large terminal subunit
MELGHKLFIDFWHLICHRRELPEIGDFIKFKTPLGDIVIFNDDGELVAFDNQCPHRGALIYQQDHGNQANTCKYHGWSYKAGKVIIPKVNLFKECDIKNVNLNKFRIEWCGDFVFLGIKPKLDLYEQLSDVAEILENISFNIDKRLDFSAYDYQCYWPLALENALEPYHIDLIHPNTLATLRLEPGTNELSQWTSVWRAPVGDQRINKQLSGLSRFFTLDYQYEGYISIFIFPFTMLSSTYGYSYSLQNFFPNLHSNQITNFTSRLLTSTVKSPAAGTVMQPFFDSSAQVNRKVFEEDHSVCKTIALGSWCMQPLRYPSAEEEKIDHFRQLCRMAKDI